MQYPLEMRFRLMSFSQQISVSGADSQPIMYVKQKMFKFREHVEVFSDSSRKQKLFDIKADRMIDFSANYSFLAADGVPWGAVRRRGSRSIWRAQYEVIEDGQIDMVIQEENPWKRVIEGLAGEIPIIGSVVTYMLNPSYIVSRPDETKLLRLTKKPAFFEGRFLIEKLSDIPPDDELRSLLSIIMISLLERRRG